MLLVQDPYLFLRGRPTLFNAVTHWSVSNACGAAMVMDDVNNTVGTKSSYTGCKTSNTGGKSKGKSENKQQQSFKQVVQVGQIPTPGLPQLANLAVSGHMTQLIGSKMMFGNHRIGNPSQVSGVPHKLRHLQNRQR